MFKKPEKFCSKISGEESWMVVLLLVLTPLVLLGVLDLAAGGSHHDLSKGHGLEYLLEHQDFGGDRKKKTGEKWHQMNLKNSAPSPICNPTFFAVETSSFLEDPSFGHKAPKMDGKKPPKIPLPGL